MSEPQSIIEQLRQAIVEATAEGDTVSQVANRAGLTRGQVSRFVAGERSPTLANAERIASALGGELVLRRRRKRLSKPPPTM